MLASDQARIATIYLDREIIQINISLNFGNCNQQENVRFLISLFKMFTKTFISLLRPIYTPILPSRFSVNDGRNLPLGKIGDEVHLTEGSHIFQTVSFFIKSEA